ncbi:unnamed protein product, partial [Phaeothamnion confervicola]
MQGASAQVELAGRIVFAKGVVLAQQAAGAPRLLGSDSQLFEGDLLSAARNGFAVIEFTDGSRMTVRPATALRISRYAHAQADESIALQLLRGGLRAVTGLITKRNPDGFRIRTATATVGIRGTDFDIRLCDEDCGAEARALAPAAPPHARVIGRVVLTSGQ